jgi:hypothetical protein
MRRFFSFFTPLQQNHILQKKSPSGTSPRSLGALVAVDWNGGMETNFAC